MLYELRTELNYKIRYTTIDNDFLTIDLIVSPDFEGYQDNDECTVFDFLALYKEMDKSNSYYPLTCECGYPDDTAIYTPVSQQVTASEIYWDMPIAGYPYVLPPQYTQDKNATVRLIFNKQQYQQSILQMISTIKSFIDNGIAISTIKEADFIQLYGGYQIFSEIITSGRIKSPELARFPLRYVHPYGGVNAQELFD